MLMGVGNLHKRQCPEDFAAQFILMGRLACEEEFRAERDTITRWLFSNGGEKLIADRKAFVKWKRRLSRREGYIGHRGGKHIPIPHSVVQEAARYLKANRGSMVVSPSRDGWRIGTQQVSPAELVAFAAILGFDPTSTLSRAHILRQIWTRP